MLSLRELTLESMAIRLIFSVLLGGIIGFERERKNQPAGLRTNILVCLGACIVMMTNQYIHQVYGSGDPVRMGAQVVSGIGFLGAGTIIVTAHNRIKGLTTAAGLWTAACIGLTLGIGLYEVALIGSVIIILVLAFLNLWDGRIHRSTKNMDVYIELEASVSLGEFLHRMGEHSLTVSGLQIEQGSHAEGLSFFVTVKSGKKTDRQVFLEKVRAIPGIRFCEFIT